MAYKDLLDKLCSPELLGFLTLAIAGGDGDDFIAIHGMSPLDTQVSETANTDHANGLAGSGAKALKRSIGGHTSAQERSSCDGKRTR